MNRTNRLKDTILLVLGLMLIGAGLNASPTSVDLVGCLTNSGAGRTLWLVPGGVEATLFGFSPACHIPAAFKAVELT
jgi:hypothetical protein